MKRSLVVAAAVAAMVASVSFAAWAGVVINETETVISGQPAGIAMQPHQRTLMIEGDKQKMVLDGGRSVIFDLDKSTMDIIDPAQKNYIEAPFPPRGMMAQNIGGPGLHASEFAKGGTSRTVASYKCDDYHGSGKLPMGEFSMVYCASSKAPGAAEYSAFQKAMAAKLKEAGVSLPGRLPDGIPLVQETTTRIGLIDSPNLPKEAAEQLKKQFADRPPMVTKTEVTKVEEKKIAAAEFQVPAGYTKRETPMGLGMGHPGMGGHAMMGPGGHAMMGPGGSPAAAASPAAKP